MLLSDPLPEGTLVQELDKSVVAVLRQLAFEPRFTNAWLWLHKYNRLSWLCLKRHYGLK
jgi:hypothetical protein